MKNFEIMSEKDAIRIDTDAVGVVRANSFFKIEVPCRLGDTGHVTQFKVESGRAEFNARSIRPASNTETVLFRAVEKGDVSLVAVQKGKDGAVLDQRTYKLKIT